MSDKPGYRQVWSGRAIVTQDGGFDLPHDRCGLDVKLTQEEAARLDQALPFAKLINETKEALVNGDLLTREDTTIEVRGETPEFHATVGTHASAGYAYLKIYQEVES